METKEGSIIRVKFSNLKQERKALDNCIIIKYNNVTIKEKLLKKTNLTPSHKMKGIHFEKNTNVRSYFLFFDIFGQALYK